ncbi:MAG: MarR family transcriptional regulator [Planctomycetota bacterium]
MGAREDLAAQTERIEFMLSQIMRAIFRFDGARRPGRRKRFDFTLAQLRIMRIVAHNEDGRMSELAKVAGVSMPTLTGTVDRLVQAGILARYRDPKDRRSVRVRLTRKGKNMRERHRRMRIQTIAAMLGKLPPAERLELARSMEKTHQIISKLADEKSVACAAR